jgi:hypothetical protein
MRVRLLGPRCLNCASLDRRAKRTVVTPIEKCAPDSTEEDLCPNWRESHVAKQCFFATLTPPVAQISNTDPLEPEMINMSTETW